MSKSVSELYLEILMEIRIRCKDLTDDQVIELHQKLKNWTNKVGL